MMQCFCVEGSVNMIVPTNKITVHWPWWCRVSVLKGLWIWSCQQARLLYTDRDDAVFLCWRVCEYDRANKQDYCTLTVMMPCFCVEGSVNKGLWIWSCQLTRLLYTDRDDAVFLRWRVCEYDRANKQDYCTLTVMMPCFCVEWSVNMIVPTNKITAHWPWWCRVSVLNGLWIWSCQLTRLLHTDRDDAVFLCWRVCEYDRANKQDYCTLTVMMQCFCVEWSVNMIVPTNKITVHWPW